MKDTHQQLARNAMAGTCDENETIFDFERLGEELAHPDERRWKPARTAMHWLTRLASHRVKPTRMPREVVWTEIFDARQLQADMNSTDDRLRASRTACSSRSAVSPRSAR